MKSKLLIASIIGVVVLSGCTLSKPGTTNSDNTVTTTPTKNIVLEECIKFLDNMYGVYGDIHESEVEVFPGKDDRHIDLSIFMYRDFWDEINDIEITKDKDGTITGYKEFSDKDSLGENKLNLTIKNNRISLVFDKELKPVKTNVIEKVKDRTKCITQQEKQRAINMVLEANCKNIDSEVFETIKDTDNYLVLRIKNYVYQEEERENFVYKAYVKEGYGHNSMSKYYNFDKRQNKLLELSDLYQKDATQLKRVNDFITSEIEDKKTQLVGSEYKEWPYQAFTSLGEPDYFENYFMIDEDKRIVKIRAVSYLIEACRSAGDLCIDVPFSIFKNM